MTVAPDAREVAPEQLGRASARSVLWNGATFATSKLLVLVTTVILARLLTPDDFGLVGIGLLVIAYLDLANDFGVSAAVVQSREDPLRVANVAFWVNMALGTTLTLIALIGAPIVADAFDEPRATAVVRVLSLSMLLTSLGAIHEARLRRELRFRRRLAPELGRAIAKGGTSITLALLGAGVWSRCGANWRASSQRPCATGSPSAGALRSLSIAVSPADCSGSARRSRSSACSEVWCATPTTW
jgi:PST family polysaccharide transporter